MTRDQVLQSLPDNPGGAENIPLALYSIEEDASGMWKLIGGIYNSDGLVEAKSPSKLNSGKSGDVFLQVRHNGTGCIYNLRAVSKSVYLL